MGSTLSGLVEGFAEAGVKAIDRSHEEEEKKRAELRADDWKVISNRHQYSNAFVDEAYNRIKKTLNPEAKKNVDKLKGFLDRLHPQKAQKQGPQQQGQPQQQRKLQPPQGATAQQPQQAQPTNGAQPRLQPPPGQASYSAQMDAQDNAKAEQADKRKLAYEKELAEARAKAQRKPTALDLRKQAEEGLADPNTPEADKKAFQGYLDSLKAHSATKKFVWGKAPNSDTPILAWVDPKDPEGFHDPESNERIEGFAPGATPTQQRLYGAVLGYYYKFLGEGNSDTVAREKAGRMFAEREGIHLGRVEQQSAIDSALSGIGMGPGFSKEFKGPATSPNGASAAPQPKSAPAPSGAKPPAAIGSKAEASARKNQDDIQYYIDTTMGTQKGGGKAATVRSMAGKKALSEATGLDPVTLNAALQSNQALGKQLGETIQRQFAIDRLTNTLDVHGDRLLEAAGKLVQTGSPLVQGPWRKAIRSVEGSPELAKYRIFATDVQREYGYLTAGGAQSRAMLPVTVTENMEKLFSEDATLQEIVTSVQAVRTSAKNEKAAMQKTRDDIVSEMQASPVGSAVRGGGKLKPPPAAEKVLTPEEARKKYGY